MADQDFIATLYRLMQQMGGGPSSPPLTPDQQASAEQSRLDEIERRRLAELRDQAIASENRPGWGDVQGQYRMPPTAVDRERDAAARAEIDRKARAAGQPLQPPGRGVIPTAIGALQSTVEAGARPLEAGFNVARAGVNAVGSPIATSINSMAEKERARKELYRQLYPELSAQEPPPGPVQGPPIMPTGAQPWTQAVTAPGFRPGQEPVPSHRPSTVGTVPQHPNLPVGMGAPVASHGPTQGPPGPTLRMPPPMAPVPSHVVGGRPTPTPGRGTGRRPPPALIGPGQISKTLSPAAMGKTYLADQLGFGPTPLPLDIKEPVPGEIPGPKAKVYLDSPPPKPKPGWQKFLEESLRDLPDIIVQYTAARYDRPDIAEAFLAKRALKIKAAQEAADLAVEREKNAATAYQMRIQIEAARGSKRQQIMDSMVALQNRMAEGKVTSLQAFIGPARAYAQEYVLNDGDGEQLLKMFQIPRADLFNKAIADADKFMTDNNGNPDAMDMAAIQNPFSDDINDRLSPRTIYDLRGQVKPDGTVLYTPPVQRVDLHDPKSKQDMTAFVPKYTLGSYLMPKNDSATANQRYHFEKTLDAGVEYMIVADGRTGQVIGRTQLGVPDSSLVGTISALNQFDQRVVMRDAAKALMAADAQAKGIPNFLPNETEVSQWMLVPQNQKEISKFISMLPSKPTIIK